MQFLNFDAAIGPLHRGFRCWNLFINEQGIVACPYTWSESFRLALHWFFGAIRDPGEALRKDVLDHNASAILSERRCQQFPLPEIGSVEVVCRYGGNEVRLHRHDGLTAVFGIARRHQTPSCQKVLRNAYAGIYRERGFPQNIISRIFKS